MLAEAVIHNVAQQDSAISTLNPPPTWMQNYEFYNICLSSSFHILSLELLDILITFYIFWVMSSMRENISSITKWQPFIKTAMIDMIVTNKYRNQKQKGGGTYKPN